MDSLILETIEVEDETIEKDANIRGEGVRECPFGLDIPDACLNAGESVRNMIPAEDNEKTKKANRLVYAYHKDCKNCVFSNKILKEHDKVDCNFGDTAEGKRVPSFSGSPIYPSTFHGVGLEGRHGYELGYNADNNETRNLFFGLFSLLGSIDKEEMIKLADKYDKDGDKEKADMLDSFLQKLQKVKDEHKEAFEKIEKYLADFRKEHQI